MATRTRPDSSVHDGRSLANAVPRIRRRAASIRCAYRRPLQRQQPTSKSNSLCLQLVDRFCRHLCQKAAHSPHSEKPLGIRSLQPSHHGQPRCSRVRAMRSADEPHTPGAASTGHRATISNHADRDTPPTLNIQLSATCPRRSRSRACSRLSWSEIAEGGEAEPAAVVAGLVEVEVDGDEAGVRAGHAGTHPGGPRSVTPPRK